MHDIGLLRNIFLINCPIGSCINGETNMQGETPLEGRAEICLGLDISVYQLIEMLSCTVSLKCVGTKSS